MEKRSWVLRPIAWICTIAMWLCVDVLLGLLCRLGGYLIYWLSGFSTLGIILLATVIGSPYLWLFWFADTALPNILVSLSDKIYPSKRGGRYLLVGISTILSLLLSMLLLIRGHIRTDGSFWLYVRLICLVFASVMLMVCSKSAVEDRRNMETKIF